MRKKAHLLDPLACVYLLFCFHHTIIVRSIDTVLFFGHIMSVEFIAAKIRLVVVMNQTLYPLSPHKHLFIFHFKFLAIKK